MIGSYKDYIGLGIAGNFALHLKQAGELEDFKEVMTEEESAPKGIFPFYIPQSKTFLGVYPLSTDTIKLPDADSKVQAEPEVALLCKIAFDESGDVLNVAPTHFAAFNDVSIREKRDKISMKKNWGECSKGVASVAIELDGFTKESEIQHFHIASFLRRDENLYRYGEDISVSNYSYFNEKLVKWIKKQINRQTDFGPLENIKSLLNSQSGTVSALITIGSTRYTQYGETTFLQPEDEVIVAVYDSRIYCQNDILSKVLKREYEGENMSILAQKVIL